MSEIKLRKKVVMTVELWPTPLGETQFAIDGAALKMEVARLLTVEFDPRYKLWSEISFPRDPKQETT